MFIIGDNRNSCFCSGWTKLELGYIVTCFFSNICMLGNVPNNEKWKPAKGMSAQ